MFTLNHQLEDYVAMGDYLYGLMSDVIHYFHKDRLTTTERCQYYDSLQLIFLGLLTEKRELVDYMEQLLEHSTF